MNSPFNQLRRCAIDYWAKKEVQWRSYEVLISKKTRAIKSRFVLLRKRTSVYWAQKIVQWRLRALLISRRIGTWLDYITISLFGLTTAAVILFVPQFRSVIDVFRPLEAILSQLGAIFGTILALVLTLSIIPIQRAGEVWSPSIMRLYRRDPVTYVTFVALGIFCVASFLFAVRGLASIPVSFVLAGALIILATTLDLLRWYHRHICRLLDPTHASQILLRQAKRSIDGISSLVTNIAKIQYKALVAEQKKNISVADIETTIYPQVPGYPNLINSWIIDLAEIAAKAVARGERFLAKTVVYAIAGIANHYLSMRKLNLEIVPAPIALFQAVESDAKLVMNCVYEALQDVSRAAVSQGDESTAIRVSEVYQIIAIHTANLEARAFREHTAPLTYTPIFYALNCVKYAQTKGLDEVPFQTAAIISGVATSAPRDIAGTDINIPIIDGLYDIATYMYGKRSFGLAEEINGHHFTILTHLIQRKDYYFKDLLHHVLEKIELLAPLAILNEAIAGRLSTIHPLHKAYGLINPNSLGYLFGMAAELLPRIETERDWLNPYRDLAGIADVIGRHLRNIAERNEFDGSFLLWEIDHLIKHIAKIVARLIDKPLRPSRGDEKELVDKFGWILSFYWVAFNGKKTVSARHADDCAESLLFIGLLFYERNYSDILHLCISNIRSILESYCEILQHPDYYAIGDMLAHLWGIRMLLVARNDSKLIKEVDQALTSKPKALTDEQWAGAKDAILRRRSQLESRLKGLERRPQPDDAENLLWQLLQEARQEDR